MNVGKTIFQPQTIVRLVTRIVLVVGLGFDIKFLVVLGAVTHLQISIIHLIGGLIMEKYDLLDICPVCSAQNIHLLDDMCEDCENADSVSDTKDPFLKTDMLDLVNSYFMGGHYGKT